MRNGFIMYVLITIFLIALFGIGINRGVMRSIFSAFQLRNIAENTSPGPQ